VCCGQNRTQLRATSKASAARLAVAVGQPKLQPGVSFVYLGNTGITVTGPASGTQYRFDRPGARVEVDPRDRILLASLRQLRQVK
jgi:chitodextrinase